MITFLIIFLVLLYFISDISYSVSTNNYLYTKEKYKFLFKKLDKEVELEESIEIENKEEVKEVKDGIIITFTTETKKSVSTSKLSFNEND